MKRELCVVERLGASGVELGLNDIGSELLQYSGRMLEW